jgi:helix-turn-helix protein
MSELIEVELDDGVVSFDGRVIESFGFGEHEAKRIHISKLEKLDLKSAGKRVLLQMKSRKGGNINAYGKPDAGKLAQLEDLVEAVTAAAPGLKE